LELSTLELWIMVGDPPRARMLSQGRPIARLACIFCIFRQFQAPRSGGSSLLRSFYRPPDSFSQACQKLQVRSSESGLTPNESGAYSEIGVLGPINALVSGETAGPDQPPRAFSPWRR